MTPEFQDSVRPGYRCPDNRTSTRVPGAWKACVGLPCLRHLGSRRRSTPTGPLQAPGSGATSFGPASVAPSTRPAAQARPPVTRLPLRVLGGSRSLSGRHFAALVGHVIRERLPAGCMLTLRAGVRRYRHGWQPSLGFAAEGPSWAVSALY